MIGCESNTQMPENDFKGYYKIMRIASSLPIDLNNDGLKSNDYLNEIQSDYLLYNGETVNYNYNPNEIWNFASASPLSFQQNTTQFLNLNFPSQRIDSVYMGNDHYEKINMEYRKLATSYIYEIKNNNVFISSDPFEHLNFIGIKNLVLLRNSKNEFNATFDYKVFDFSDNEWMETQLNVSYLLVEEEN